MLPEHPKALRSIDAIETAAHRGEHLTRQMLAFSRRQPLNPTSLQIHTRIGSISAMLSTLVGAKVTLDTDIPPDTWPFEADLDEFELALVNLASNARDAMPDGGTVRLICENVQLVPDSTHELQGDFVALTVADTATEFRPTSCPRSSIRSSPPKIAATAPALVSAKCTASRTSQKARSSAKPARPRHPHHHVSAAGVVDFAGDRRKRSGRGAGQRQDSIGRGRCERGRGDVPDA